MRSHTKSQQLQACKADAFQCCRYFEELLSVFSLPEYQPGDPEYVPDDPLQNVRKSFDLLAATFREAFVAGTIIVVDETMIFWTGMGIHLTYLPRKPTPLGIMLKTICGASTRILLGWEFCEGKEVDARKQWQNLHGAGTACTLRLTQPWHGSNKIVIGDSWFGSLKCCAHLLSHGLWSILNIKTAHKAFPKQACLAALKDRGDTIWYELELQISGKKRKLYAGGHMGKAPLVLVASCSTSLPGEPQVRHRSFFANGEVQRNQYQPAQPKMHALYRKNFNAVDVSNRLAEGPNCLSDAWRTRQVLHRLVAASLSTCVTNAYQAWMQVHALTSATYPQQQFKIDLAESLFKMHNEMLAGRLGRGRRSTQAKPAADDHLRVPDRFASHAFGHTDERRMCDVCSARQTNLKCSCGTYVCAEGKKNDVRHCMLQHLDGALAGTQPGSKKRKVSNSSARNS